MVKISDLIFKGADKIVGVAHNPRGEARILLAHILSTTVSDIIVRQNDSVEPEVAELFDSLISERMAGKPIAYITGRKEFFGLGFKVNKHTLIPRPETEFVVDEIINSGRKNLLDLCTGSGCIPIAAALNCDITAIGIDISSEAVKIATENALLNGISEKVTFEAIDVLTKDFFGKFDIISSNPPYITDKDMLSLPPDVANFEPHIALAGGSDGLIFYKRIIETAPKNLLPDGILIFEVGMGQATQVESFMKKDFTDIKIIKDLAGIDRVVSGVIKGEKYV